MQSYALGAVLPGLLNVSGRGWWSMLVPPPRWSVDDIPDLSGKVIIVTGGNANIGRETVKALLVHNAKVYLGARNERKARAVIETLKSEIGHEAVFLKLDLATLRSVKSAADEFLSKENKLDVLVNNAASQYPPVDQLTSEGHDLQFGTNVLGHFYFTQLLLLATAKASPDGKARVVHVASVGHEFVNGVDLADTPKRRTLHPTTLYFQSKFGNVLVAKEFHRRYADQGLVSCSLHPGNLRFDTERHPSLIIRLMSNINPFLPGAQLGAFTQLWAATSPEGVDFGGKYLIPWARMGTAKKETEDPELAKKLWDWLEEQIRKHQD
ncbi:NAD(P)-binding protein [Daedalea quercina L-15889]|uniref:NAD(P)-binding protein n=1 Tax=Daedalea quercina L-15889 TaxID=1314783 RepID=A0A165R439_9APHY|nr:NAD(P)-binding protein [Daedalea quercina L-15889]